MIGLQMMLQGKHDGIWHKYSGGGGDKMGCMLWQVEGLVSVNASQHHSFGLFNPSPLQTINTAWELQGC